MTSALNYLLRVIFHDEKWHILINGIWQDKFFFCEEMATITTEERSAIKEYYKNIKSTTLTLLYSVWHIDILNLKLNISRCYLCWNICMIYFYSDRQNHPYVMVRHVSSHVKNNRTRVMPRTPCIVTFHSTSHSTRFFAILTKFWLHSFLLNNVQKPRVFADCMCHTD